MNNLFHIRQLWIVLPTLLALFFYISSDNLSLTLDDESDFFVGIVFACISLVAEFFLCKKLKLGDIRALYVIAITLGLYNYFRYDDFSDYILQFFLILCGSLIIVTAHDWIKDGFSDNNQL